MAHPLQDQSPNTLQSSGPFLCSPFFFFVFFFFFYFLFHIHECLSHWPFRECKPLVVTVSKVHGLLSLKAAADVRFEDLMSNGSSPSPFGRRAISHIALLIKLAFNVSI